MTLAANVSESFGEIILIVPDAHSDSENSPGDRGAALPATGVSA